jgi:hypothetical protein
MQIPSKKEVELLRKRYPVGSRVRLIHMDDECAPPEGTVGTIQGIDDIGDIMVAWDIGSSLKLIAECDSFSLEI